MSLHLLPIDDMAASTLVADAWQGALLTLAAAFALRLVPGISAAGRFCAWAALFVILMLLPFVQHPHASAAGSGIHVASWWSVVVALLWVSVSLLRAAQLAHAFLLLRTFSRRARPLLTLPPSAARNAPLCLSSDVSRPSVVGFFRPKILIPDALYARLTLPNSSTSCFMNSSIFNAAMTGSICCRRLVSFSFRSTLRCCG